MPKIQFYVFAIAYLPTLLPPTQLFFSLFQNYFYFVVVVVLAVSIFQFQVWNTWTLSINKKKKKKNHTGSFYPPLVIFVSYVITALFIYFLT